MHWPMICGPHNFPHFLDFTNSSFSLLRMQHSWSIIVASSLAMYLCAAAAGPAFLHPMGCASTTNLQLIHCLFILLRMRAASNAFHWNVTWKHWWVLGCACLLAFPHLLAQWVVACFTIIRVIMVVFSQNGTRSYFRLTRDLLYKSLNLQIKHLSMTRLPCQRQGGG